MIDELCSGLSLALMIESMSDYDVVETFREFCGPYQPELAAAVRPKSLRAIFGESISKNGVHCTDLSEDGLMECKFIFETLPNL